MNVNIVRRTTITDPIIYMAVRYYKISLGQYRPFAIKLLDYIDFYEYG